MQQRECLLQGDLVPCDPESRQHFSLAQGGVGGESLFKSEIPSRYERRGRLNFEMDILTSQSWNGLYINWEPALGQRLTSSPCR